MRADKGWRGLCAAVLLALLFGAIELGTPLENTMRTARNKLRRHAPSGDIIIVAIDDRSLAEVNAWPWPRRHHAALADKLRERGARRVFFDIDFSNGSGADDAVFAVALAKWNGRATLARQFVVDEQTGTKRDFVPLPMLRRHANVASINSRYGYDGKVWNLPYAVASNGTLTPSFAVRLAGSSEFSERSFAVDYAIDPSTFPVTSAAAVIAGAKDLSFEGKDVIVGITSQYLNDMQLVPVYGRLPGMFIHAIGAETLRAGTPLNLGWLPPFLLGLLTTIVAGRASRLRTSLGVAGLTSTLLILAPLLLDGLQVTIIVVPALFLITTVATIMIVRRMRQLFRTRGKVNAMSGLPNLAALRADADAKACVLIAARIGNYAELAAALTEEEEGDLVRQIAHRLTLGDAKQKIYQGDEGIFVWLANGTTADVGEHLDALHRLFRTPLVCARLPVDAAVSFGVDAPSDRPVTNRLASALVAAGEAVDDGCRWKASDEARLADAPWRLSLLGQLDRAIDNGDLWVAYQAKLDLASGRVSGAEALVRWTHPEKGPVPPLDFILAAEQHDRIERLTRFVLDQAVRAAADINAAGFPFNIAVNLSTRLMGDGSFPELVAQTLLRHGLAASQLTLEVTETAAMGSGGNNLTTLSRLRAMGVSISIDDYGTGLSTLEYLRKIPSNEIKIDQSFVGSVTRSRSDRLMVHSTIELVHSLGQSVVAEGVEDAATLDALVAMGCNFAQGFWIGKPVPLHDFSKTLSRSTDKLFHSRKIRLQG